jgi:hypothetical protein
LSVSTASFENRWTEFPWVYWSLVTANFFVENFEEVALSRAVCKLTCWFHYVDDMFMIWPHGPKELNNLTI